MYGIFQRILRCNIQLQILVEYPEFLSYIEVIFLLRDSGRNGWLAIRFELRLPSLRALDLSKLLVFEALSLILDHPLHRTWAYSGDQPWTYCMFRLILRGQVQQISLQHPSFVPVNWSRKRFSYSVSNSYDITWRSLRLCLDIQWSAICLRVIYHISKLLHQKLLGKSSWSFGPCDTPWGKTQLNR